MPRRLFKPLLPCALLMLPILAGCATHPTRIAATAKPSESAACIVLNTLSFSKDDTDFTIEEIKEYDAARAKLCPSSSPKK